MKNKIILLILCNASLLFGQSAGCDCVLLKQGQDILSVALDKTKAELKEKSAELESTKKKISASAGDIERTKGEKDRLQGENQLLNTQLADNKTTIQNLNDELTKLKEQLRLKTTEATNNKNEAEKEKNEVEILKARNEKLNGSISGTATGATCINEWLNDRISKTQGKILMQNRAYNLYERNEAAAEICAITFENNSPTIKHIKVGDEIFDKSDKIECMLNRIENLFYHYQDLYFLRFAVRNKTAGEAQFAYIKERFYKKTFDQEKKIILEEQKRDVELKRLTIVKWSKGNENSNTISISIAVDKENSDPEFFKR